jgi:2-keto-3-deoxy-L-rhamnonate aldolase RhmA
LKDNAVKTKLARNEVTLGTWVTIGNSDVAEVMAWSGFDWIIFDMEHGPLDVSTLETMAQAVSAAPALPVARVPANDPAQVKRTLDLGIPGVMIPYVNTRDEAVRAVASAKYPPTGIRGVAPRRASMYGLEWDDYLKNANNEVLVVIQVETVEAVKNIDEILKVEGIDVLFVGPLDLSFSAGFPSQTTRPEVQTLIRSVATAAENAGIRTGIHSPLGQIRHYVEMGFRFIATGGDTDFLLDGAKQAVDAKNEAIRGMKISG